MKEIEVIVVRRVETSYIIEVSDSFDIEAASALSNNALKALEDAYFNDEWVYVGDEEGISETLNWEIDYVGEVK